MAENQLVIIRVQEIQGRDNYLLRIWIDFKHLEKTKTVSLGNQKETGTVSPSKPWRRNRGSKSQQRTELSVQVETWIRWKITRKINSREEDSKKVSPLKQSAENKSRNDQAYQDAKLWSKEDFPQRKYQNRIAARTSWTGTPSKVSCRKRKRINAKSVDNQLPTTNWLSPSKLPMWILPLTHEWVWTTTAAWARALGQRKQQKPQTKTPTQTTTTHNNQRSSTVRRWNSETYRLYPEAIWNRAPQGRVRSRRKKFCFSPMPHCSRQLRSCLF